VQVTPAKVFLQVLCLTRDHRRGCRAQPEWWRENVPDNGVRGLRNTACPVLEIGDGDRLSRGGAPAMQAFMEDPVTWPAQAVADWNRPTQTLVPRFPLIGHQTAIQWDSSSDWHQAFSAPHHLTAYLRASTGVLSLPSLVIPQPLARQTPSNNTHDPRTMK